MDNTSIQDVLILAALWYSAKLEERRNFKAILPTANNWNLKLHEWKWRNFELTGREIGVLMTPCEPLFNVCSLFMNPIVPWMSSSSSRTNSPPGLRYIRNYFTRPIKNYPVKTMNLKIFVCLIRDLTVFYTNKESQRQCPPHQVEQKCLPAFNSFHQTN